MHLSYCSYVAYMYTFVCRSNYDTKQSAKNYLTGVGVAENAQNC